MRAIGPNNRRRKTAQTRSIPVKKIVVVALAAVFLGAGAYFMFAPSKDNEYAQYLPQEAVATLNLLHLGQLSESFAATPLGRFLAKETMHGVITDMGGSSADLAGYDQTFDGIADVMTNPAFKAVFGEDATVALLPVEQGSLQASPATALRANLVVLARTTVAGALDLFSRLVKNANISREVVDGLELTRVVLDPEQILYGYAEGKMVFLAYSPAAIKRCLLAGERDGHRLAGAKGFVEAGNYWKATDREQTFARLFINPKALSGLLAEVPDRKVKQSAAMLQGMDVIYSVTYAGENGLESRTHANYRYEQLSPLAKSAIDAATHPNPTLFLLRDNSLAYSWVSSLRPELINQVLAESGLELAQVDSELRELLGVGLEELEKGFGPQYGIVLDDIVRAALFPAPKMTFFVGLRDRAVAGSVVEAIRARIAKSGMIREEQEQVDGYTVYCWPLLSDKDAQPALAMNETMLFLATSKQALLEVLQAKTKANSLSPAVTALLGTSLSERISSANTGSLVIYPKRMSAKTEDSLGWLSGILATTKNISLARFNEEVMRLLRSTEVVSATSTMSRDQADWSLSLHKAQAQAGAVRE